MKDILGYISIYIWLNFTQTKYVDGLIETRDADAELYGMEKLEAFVKNHTDQLPGLFNNSLLEEINAFRSGPVADDIFLLTIDIK